MLFGKHSGFFLNFVEILQMNTFTLISTPMLRNFTNPVRLFLLLGILFTALQAQAQLGFSPYNGYEPDTAIAPGETTVGQPIFFEAQGLDAAGLRITAPANFEVSLTGDPADFSDTIYHAVDGDGNTGFSLFYIRFVAPLMPGTYSGYVGVFNLNMVPDSIYVEAEVVSGAVVTSYTWNNNGPGTWSNPNSWIPTRTTANAADILIIDGTGAPIPISINVDGTGTTEVGQLKLINAAQVNMTFSNTGRILSIGADSAGADLLVTSGSSLTLQGTNVGNLAIKSGNTAEIYGLVNFKDSAHKLYGAAASSIVFKSGGHFLANSTYPVTGTFTPNPFGGTASGASPLVPTLSVIFEAGSTYTQRGGASPFGNALNASPVTVFQSGSNYLYQGGSTVLLARTYGNLIMNKAGSAQIAGSGFSVETFTVSAGTVIISGGSPLFKGNITIASGAGLSVNSATTFSLASQTISGAGTLTFGGTGNVTIASTANLTLAKNIEMNKALVVNGTLNAGTSVISGSGTFTVSSTGRIISNHPNGLSGTLTISSINMDNASLEFGAGVTSTGTMPASIKSLTINTPAGIVLSSPTEVTGSLVLNGKITTSATNLLTVRNSTTISGVSASNFIVGPMALSAGGTTSTINFTFPIGTSNDYRPVSLSLNHSNPLFANYTAKIVDNQSYTLPIQTGSEVIEDSIFAHKRYFSIERSGEPNLVSAGISITVADDYGTVNAHQTAHRRRATIVKSDDVTGEWIDLGADGSAEYNSSTGTLSSGLAFNSFSNFAYAVGRYLAVPLPVSIISLDAKPVADKVEVVWATAMEKDNNYFEVERSLDGKNFTSIGQVTSRGNSDYKVNYSFTDANPAKGVAYYRLRQVDFDGTTSFFGPVAARINGTAPVITSVYPNPVTTVANLSLELAPKEEAQVRVISLIGTIVLEKTISSEDGAGTYELPVNTLQPGAYIIEVTTATGRTASRFVKQ